MELLQLEYFKAVADSGHVTETAQRLNVTQSSVSRTIQRLEEDLGAKLFDRVGRSLRLNDFGRAFLLRVDKALGELAQGRQEIQDRTTVDHGFVKLAVNTASTLPGILGLFRKEHPRTQFHVSMVTTDEMLQLLTRGAVDFGLCSSMVSEPGIHCQRVLLEPIVLAVPLGHRLSGQGPVNLVELQDEPFIGVKRGFGPRELTDALCQSAGFLPRHVFEGDEPARINSLVEAGIGIAFVPSASRSTHDAIEYVAIADERFVRELALLRPEGHYLSRAAAEFQSVVLDYFSSAPNNS